MLFFENKTLQIRTFEIEIERKKKKTEKENSFKCY